MLIRTNLPYGRIDYEEISPYTSGSKQTKETVDVRSQREIVQNEYYLFEKVDEWVWWSVYTTY